MTGANVFSSKGGLAYTELRRRITSGELAPGSRLSQYELAEEMGMSITPLREAIRRLASEDWVVMDTHRDVRVAAMSASEARELLEARFSLEPSATELAALRRTEREIAAMRAAADALLPVTRTWGEEAIAAHRAFHRAIYTASHNNVMIRLLDDLWDKADRYRRIGLELPAGAEPRTIDLNQHHEILELVVIGDGAAAAGLVRSHILNSLGAMVTDTLEGREHAAYHPIAGH
ncbi:GntR family transcriptional regulator [Nocardiopsis changdeensis]|uniref:GntR family transcriptional regulator n=1 Tax=Nocardiopsis changdeensis TaxID=2831969 RepID=A0ABX8BE50_9ACTN|nr:MULTISPECIES: GntR family transcriptional regulator [Nocardiopsis]QUX20520.1 GntR family transcriptional regulator [Nocardiopsis changdeensis]QYX36451.1 GntR family transcriptional regulator [Nocardiopsis sp. MT53]